MDDAKYHSNPIILFDGICNLCTASVQFVIKHDKKRHFLFTSLQSESGKQLLKHFQLSAGSIDSFVLVKNKKVYLRSSAALHVLAQLDGIIKLLYVFIIVPPFIRDAVYKIIANNRYKWFGKRKECWLPTKELNGLFI